MKNHILFLFLSLLLATLAFSFITNLLQSSVRSVDYSYLPIIPLISAYALILDRKRVFSELGRSYILAIVFLVMGILIYTIGMVKSHQLNMIDYSFLSILATVFLFWGLFNLLYGRKAFVKSIFAQLFLILMIPIPSQILDTVIHLIRKGSIEIAYLIIKTIGIPVFREGFIFHLSNISVEVTKGCSGIRSVLGLVIISIVIAHFFIRSGWHKTMLFFSIVPLILLQNGMRIVSLSIWANNVNERILTEKSFWHSGDGFLHAFFGFIFFIPALIGIYWFLRICSRKTVDP